MPRRMLARATPWLAALLVAAGSTGTRAAPPPDIAARLSADSAAANALMQSGRVDSAFSLFSATLRVVRASGDRRLLLKALMLDGRARAALGLPALAVQELDEASRLAAALGDSATWVRVLRWRTYSLGNLGRMAEKEASARQQLAVAEAIGDVKHQANARTFLGWDAHQRGDYREAITQLEWAASRLRTLNDPDEALALITLGSAHLKLDDFEAARVCDRRALEVARAAHNEWLEAQALNDLGVIEAATGDPSAAALAYQQAYALHRKHNAWPDAVLSLANLTNAETALGRHDDAIAHAREGVALCESRGMRQQLGSSLGALGVALEAAGRDRQAERVYRSVLALGDTTAVSPRVFAATRLSGMWTDADSASRALELVDRFRRETSGRTSVDDAARLADARAAALEGAGRTDEAFRSELEAVALAERDQQGDLEIATSVYAARLARRLGRTDEAAGLLARAERVWTGWRSRPSDPEWREAHGGTTPGLAAALVSLRLVHPTKTDARVRLESAFATAQRFKTRTLLERMSGAGRAAADSSRWSPASLADVQHDVLRDGELLFEFVEGRDTSVVFVVSRDTCAVARLPGRDWLESRLLLVRDLVARPPVAGERSEAARAAAELGSRLWGEWAPLIARAHTILVAPDGLFHLAPFEIIPLDGAAPRLKRTLARVPSATVLAALRSRPPAVASGGALLAFAGGLQVRGERLTGALAEVRTLGRRYRGVTVRTSLDTTGTPVTIASFAPFGALHFAGHTVVDDQNPWRSSITVREAGAQGESLRVLARDIATSRQSAALAVLSSCESAAGRIRSGEGVEGLSTAFIASGVPAVVATLWPVDDRTTERVMDRFYDGLAHGLPAGEALDDARRRIAAGPATAHPFFWAGYVLIGEPGTRLALAANPLSPSRVGSYLVLAALLASALLAWRGLRRLKKERGV